MKVKLLNGLDKDEAIRICTSAGLLSRNKGKVTDVLTDVYGKDIESAKRLLNRIIGMGHTSIVDHDYLVFAVEDVPVIIEQMLISSRFSSFTIKSRREANFSKDGFIVPEFKDKNGNLLDNGEQLREKYINHMDSLIEDYSTLIDLGIIKEDARYILPYCFKSQILFGMSATELSKMINKLTNSKWANIDIVNKFGKLLKNAASEKSDYIETIISKFKTQKNSPIEETFETVLENLNDFDYKILNEPTLIDHTNDIDKSIVINSLMRIYQFDYKKSLMIYEKFISGDENAMNNIFMSYNEDINKIDLKQINIKFQVPFSFANLTHITRHRTTILSIPDFVPNINLKNIIKPNTIMENLEAKKIFENAHKRNLEVYNEMKNLGIREEDLVYFTLSANQVNIILTFDGETLKHIFSVRSCDKAQWEIRSLIHSMENKIKRIAPYYYKIIGSNCEVLGYCPEGKECCGKVRPKKIQEGIHEG